MSALSVKRAMEARAGLAQDTAGLSGADLAQAVGRNEASLPNQRANYDGARLEQVGVSGVKDSFAGVNAQAINGRLTTDGRKTWVTSANGMTINTNALVHDGVGTVYATLDTGLLDNFGVRYKVNALTSDGARIIIRADAASAASLAVYRQQTANTWTLVNNTGPVTLDTKADAVDLVPGDIVECQVRGNDVTVLVNDVVRVVLSGAASLYPAGGRQGLLGVAANGFTADDFSVYRLA